MSTTLEWRNVGDVKVGDKLAQIVAARHGEKLANVELRASWRRALVLEADTDDRGDVTLKFRIGSTTITRTWLPDAILAVDKVSTCETNLVNEPNLAIVANATPTHTDLEV